MKQHEWFPRSKVKGLVMLAQDALRVSLKKEPRKMTQAHKVELLQRFSIDFEKGLDEYLDTLKIQ